MTNEKKYNYGMIIRLLLIYIILITLTGCTANPRFTGSPSDTKVSSRGKSSGDKKRLNNKSIPVTFKKGTTWECSVSYYGKKFHGRKTANGERFDMYGISAAHKTLPFDTMVNFVNLSNGRKLRVRVNDRGPYIEGREFDLSYGAAKKLGMVAEGVGRMEVTILKIGEN